MRCLVGLILAAVLAASASGAARSGEVSGRASYRERLALPPGAVFEAVLEETTDADAPPRELGRTTIEDPGNPPFAFEIDYDPESVSTGRSYSVRAQISVGRRMILVSETPNPVLMPGAPADVELRMLKVGETSQEAREAPATIGAHGLRLPASFDGRLECAGCDAVAYRLNLWPDQVFHLRRSWEESDARRDSIGRWSVDPDQQVLTVRGTDEELRFRILGADRLELLPRDAEAGDAGMVLEAGNGLEPFDPQLPLRGMLTYVADQARFTECLTGRDYPLVKDGDYAALEHAYLAAGAEPGGPIMASFDGGIVRNGDEAAAEVMVERFVGVWPGETCERAGGTARLTNTYWKVLRLGDTEVVPDEGRREPSLILGDATPRFTATVGCNQVSGSYRLDEEHLSFGNVAAGDAACPAPLEAWERQLARVLSETALWRIDGQTLELFDAGSNALALFQAVYLY